MKFRLLIDKERCKGCALCVAACARRALALTKAINSRGCHYAEFDDPEDGCTGCRKCGEVCPDAAISITRVRNGEGEIPDAG